MMNKERILLVVSLSLVFIISLSFVFAASAAKIDGVVKFRGYQYFAYSNGERSQIYARDDGTIYSQRPSFGGIATDYFWPDKKLGDINVEPLGNFVDLDSSALDYIEGDLFNQMNGNMIDEGGEVVSGAEEVELKITRNGVKSASGITINGRGYLNPSNNKNEKIGEIDKTGKISMYDPSTYSDETKLNLGSVANQIHNTRAERGTINDLTKLSDEGYASQRVKKTQTKNPIVEALKRTGQRLVDAVTGKRPEPTPPRIPGIENPVKNPVTKPSPENPVKPTPSPKPTPKPTPKPKPVKNISKGGGILPSTPINCYDGTIMGTTSPLQCGCKTELSYVKSTGKCNLELGVPSATDPPAYRTFKCVKPEGDDSLNMVWQQDVDNCCISKGGDGYCAQQYAKKYPVCDNSDIPGKCIAGCTKNSDCPSFGGVATDKICDTSITPGKCVECLQSSDCTSGKVCSGNKCVEGANQGLSCSSTWEQQNYIQLPFYNIEDKGICGDGYCSGEPSHFESWASCREDCIMHPDMPICGNCVCDEYAGGYATHNNRNRGDEGECNCPHDCTDSNFNPSATKCGNYYYPNGQQMI